MGMERVVRTGDETPAPWSGIDAALRTAGESPLVRMIDGELSLPHEVPPDNWQEVRVSLRGGMVTLRHVPEGIACIAWGNADAVLLHSWRKAIWAVLAATGCGVEEDGQFLLADDFSSRHGLHAS